MNPSCTVEDACDLARDWFTKYRPFAAWLDGMSIQPHGEEGVDYFVSAADDLIQICSRVEMERISNARKQCRYCQDHAMILGCLSRWAECQRLWLVRILDSPSLLRSTFIARDAWLEEEHLTDHRSSFQASGNHLRWIVDSVHAHGGPNTSSRFAEFDVIVGGSTLGRAFGPRQEIDTSVREVLGQPLCPSMGPINIDHSDVTERLLHAAEQHRGAWSNIDSEVSVKPSLRAVGDSQSAITEFWSRSAEAFFDDLALSSPSLSEPGPAMRRIVPQAMFLPSGTTGHVYVNPESLHWRSASRRDVAAFLLALAHEGIPGHSANHQASKTGVLRKYAFLRDRYSSEGWAVFSEALVGTLSDDLNEAALWMQIKRLIPLAVAGTRAACGKSAADELIRQVSRISPHFFSDPLGGLQSMVSNRAYGEGLMRTEMALASLVEEGDSTIGNAIRLHLARGGVLDLDQEYLSDGSSHPPSRLWGRVRQSPRLS